MKCTNCGNEFEGNFCTNCGAKAESGSVPSENIQTVIESNEVNGDTGAKASISNAAAEKADSEGGGIFSKLFDFAFLIVITVLMVKFDIGVGWIIGYWIFSLIEFGADIFLDEQKGLCAAVKCLAGIFDVFLMIRIGVSIGIMLLYLVIMIAHTILEYKKHALAKPAEIVSWVLGLIILFQLYNIYQDYRYANTVKEYQYATGVTYGDLLDTISDDVLWECTDRERFNIAGEGTYDAVVRAWGDVKKLAPMDSDVDPNAEYIIQFYVEKQDNERVKPVKMEVYAYGQTTTTTDEADIDDLFSGLYMRNFFGQILAD